LILGHFKEPVSAVLQHRPVVAEIVVVHAEAQPSFHTVSALFEAAPKTVPASEALQPPAHLKNLFATQAERASATNGTADGQNGLRMFLTAGAFGAPAAGCGSGDD
jgi:hypothetical protein